MAATAPAPYPPGRWRLASEQELEQVVLWVSHLLIRHRDSEKAQAPLTLASWARLGAPPDRTPDEARRIGLELERTLRADPAEFSRLTKLHSEDPVTSPDGGRLGGVSGFYLSQWPELLDALAGTPEGAVSRLVETSDGFHLLLRERPPAPEPIAGRRIVIGYDAAPSLDHQRRADRPRASRSREAALGIALDVVRRLREPGADFRAFVERYSELGDAARGGDLGVWSNREPTELYRELVALSKLSIGGISDPVDTHLGFQILQREPATERPAYAAALIQLQYDPTAEAGSERARDVMENKAASIRALLASNPGQFSNFQAKFCCAEPRRWSRGRGPVGLWEALDRTPVGELAPGLVASDSTFIIARKLEAASVPEPPSPVFELPAPAGPQLARLVRVADGAALGRFCRELALEAATRLALNGATLQKFEAFHSSLAADFEKAVDAERKAKLMEAAFTRAEKLLGAELYERYRGIIDARVESQVMGIRVETK